MLVTTGKRMQVTRDNNGPFRAIGDLTKCVEIDQDYMTLETNTGEFVKLTAGDYYVIIQTMPDGWEVDNGKFVKADWSTDTN